MLHINSTSSHWPIRFSFHINIHLLAHIKLKAQYTAKIIRSYLTTITHFPLEFVRTKKNNVEKDTEKKCMQHNVCVMCTHS